jgi:Domain of unknown function (DUF4160)
MPTILKEKGFRLFFYSDERNEPCHVHIEKGDAYGKIWLEPVLEINYLINFTTSEEKDIMEIVLKNIANFKKKWNEYFTK